MKVAISIPDPLFEAAEDIARVRSVPRSKLYSEALSHYIREHDADKITTRLNQVYSDYDARLEAELTSAQSEMLQHESW